MAPVTDAAVTQTSASSPTSKRPIWRVRIRTVRRWLFRWTFRCLVVLSPFLLIAAYLLWREFKTSAWQAQYFSRIAKEATFTVAPGPNPHGWFPAHGPYDERLGYTRIPSIVKSLTENGYEVSLQTRLSPRFLELAEMGIYPPYREKTRAGITILDRKDTTIYSAYRPERVYDTFELMPDLVVKSLLYIENREILDQQYPTKNPAVEWDRLGLAVLEKAKQVFQPDLNAPGGSTIATQLEKYRHSREGRTGGVRDKLMQMGSASLRAYMYGEDTLPTRRLIVLQYINSIPLAALPGYGEVNGLGDGLWAWYGADFDDINRNLKKLAALGPNDDVTPYAESYKQMLSLFIAHRRPSYYLIAGLEELNKLTNTYVELLAREGVISAKLRDAAIGIRLTLRRAAPKAAPISFVQRKAANAIRTRLLKLMNVQQLYDLDQADLTVKSTMDNVANEGVTDILRQIKDEASVKKFGLSGARNLARGDPSKVIYSLTLYEHVGNANLLRVQTDNFDKPFSINEGTRLDLGSTAKLRTLTTYLDVVGEIYDRYSVMKTAEIRSEIKRGLDPISQFVAEAVASNPKLELTTLLSSAMERRYSANPGETFFTGGGVHHFENFKRDDDGKNPTLQEALTASINLPFVRLMRDLSRFYTSKLSQSLGGSPTDKKSPVRMHFLRKFADQEGSYFMRQFYQKYRAQPASGVLDALVKGSRASAKHAAAMYRYVRPTGTVEEMSKFLRDNVKNATLSLNLVEKWYEDFAPGKFSLNDQGYLARIHPLELWLVKFIQDTPGASIVDALEASANERQEVYQWLFNSPSARAQDSRIRTLIEVEAFLEIHKQWKKVGYPFNSMVPSLASAIGSSGDRPAALAELVGIILNDGVRYPLVRLDELHFAAETPFETLIRRTDGMHAERVLKPEVARTLKYAMSQVVEKGTARRVHQTFVRSDGKAYVIGGKTGTGDHRFETFGPGGQLLHSRVVNRTATFAFYIGDRFFGVISAHVPGAEAAKFDFTSALAAELLKVLSKSLVPMIESSGTELSPFTKDAIKIEETKQPAPVETPVAPIPTATSNAPAKQTPAPKSTAQAKSTNAPKPTGSPVSTPAAKTTPESKKTAVAASTTGPTAAPTSKPTPKAKATKTPLPAILAPPV